MKISLLVPCFNEEKSLEACLNSYLNQTRQFDEIIFVDDSSTDRTPEILARYADKIIVRRTPKNSGNKSHAQEFGMQFISGDIFVTTDADTILERNFAKEIEKDFTRPEVMAVAGYVRSLKYNWLTACRALDYSIGQNLYKLAQDNINFLFVIPGAAGAFRTEIFKKYIGFDHDTLTEDLDFTYKLHKNDLKLIYNRQAIAYTQDPVDLRSYINQMRRWYSGGWQNLIKHLDIVKRPAQAFELSFMYIEGLIFSALIFLIPLLSVYAAVIFLAFYFVIAPFFAYYCAAKEDRPDFLLYFPLYPFVTFINAYVFLEQFFKEVILRKKNLVWLKPKRITLQ